MMRSRIVSAAALVLALAMCISTFAPAAVKAREYITASSASISKVSSGTVKIEFSVIGKFGVNEAGAKKVVVYESPDNITWKSL